MNPLMLVAIIERLTGKKLHGEDNLATGSICLMVLLEIVLVTLKFLGLLTWPWMVILIPIWILAAGFALSILAILVLTFRNCLFLLKERIHD